MALAQDFAFSALGNVHVATAPIKQNAAMSNSAWVTGISISSGVIKVHRRAKQLATPHMVPRQSAAKHSRSSRKTVVNAKSKKRRPNNAHVIMTMEPCSEKAQPVKAAHAPTKDAIWSSWAPINSTRMPGGA
eukprot:CAMPEP_0179031036 /NCGR_PEP_ID=MMETSP0796-20121207/10867_1 /TAXON_ID=73915 /ORGANISM="Pyrodinium bahamense, Strain pbaha01" /LENGTH=131 /DNA_ID=CAMNT_0020727223 /DNA_START=14 /DNA_END=409 /DNA_ORIENTATION=+